MVRLQIVYAAKSKSTYNVELNRVEVEGPFLLAKALMVCSQHSILVALHGTHIITCLLQPDVHLTNSSPTLAPSLLLDAGCSKQAGASAKAVASWGKTQHCRFWEWF